MKVHKKHSKLWIFQKFIKLKGYRAGKSISALGRIWNFPPCNWHTSVSHKNSAIFFFFFWIFFWILIAQWSIWLKISLIMNNLVIFVLYWSLSQNFREWFSCNSSCGYGYPALIHAWIASAVVLEWFTSTRGNATRAYKPF
jgi:hypothetical protein